MRVIENDRLWSAASDGAPAHIPRYQIHALGDVDEQDFAALGDEIHRIGVEAQGRVEVGRAGSLVAAGARQGESALLGELEAAGVGPVECPGVVSLIANREGPGTWGLPDKVK